MVTSAISRSSRSKSSRHSPTARNKKTDSVPLRSFRVARNNQPFLTLQPTSQTFYWFVIGVLVVILGAWALSMAASINSIYDDVDAINDEPINYTVAGTKHHPLIETTNTSH